jgi:hypothetical protein
MIRSDYKNEFHIPSTCIFTTYSFAIITLQTMFTLKVNACVCVIFVVWLISLDSTITHTLPLDPILG